LQKALNFWFKMKGNTKMIPSEVAGTKTDDKIKLSLNMYSILPSKDIQMQELIEMCEKRLELLRKIDDE
jgi:hypothetical protein